jgi:hypothetical protein
LLGSSSIGSIQKVKCFAMLKRPALPQPPKAQIAEH